MCISTFGIATANHIHDQISLSLLTPILLSDVITKFVLQEVQAKTHVINYNIRMYCNSVRWKILLRICIEGPAHVDSTAAFCNLVRRATYSLSFDVS